MKPELLPCFVTLLFLLRMLESAHVCEEVGTTVESVRQDICNKSLWNGTAECKADGPQANSMHCSFYCNATAIMWTTICTELDILSTNASHTMKPSDIIVRIDERLKGPFGTVTTNAANDYETKPKTYDHDRYREDPETVATDDHQTDISHNYLTYVYMHSTIALGSISGTLLVGIVGLTIVLVWTYKRIRKMKHLLVTKKSHDTENESPLDNLSLSNSVKPPSDLRYQTKHDNSFQGPTYDEIPNPSKPSVTADYEVEVNGEHIYDVPKEKAAGKTKQRANNLRFLSEEQNCTGIYDALERRESRGRAPNGEQPSHQNLEDMNNFRLEQHTQPQPYEDVQLASGSESDLINEHSFANKSGNFTELSCKEQSIPRPPSANREAKPSHNAGSTQIKMTRELSLSDSGSFQHRQELGNDIVEHHYHVLNGPSVNTQSHTENSGSMSHHVCQADGENGQNSRHVSTVTPRPGNCVNTTPTEESLTLPCVI